MRSGQFSRRLWGSTRRISQVSSGETEYNPVEPPGKWAPRAFGKTFASEPFLQHSSGFLQFQNRDWEEESIMGTVVNIRNMHFFNEKGTFFLTMQWFILLLTNKHSKDFWSGESGGKHFERWWLRLNFNFKSSMFCPVNHRLVWRPRHCSSAWWT